MQSRTMVGWCALAAAVMALMHPVSASGQQTTFVVAAAGDPCDSTPNDCNGTAKAVEAISPHEVWMLGDGAYDDGTLAEYRSYYDPNWGRFKAKTRPILGNHDFYAAGSAGTNAVGYFDYFNGIGVNTGPAGTRGQGYYSWNLGDWHIVALNSGKYGTTTTAQLDWLKADLAANNKPCTAILLHHPLISWGGYAPGTGQTYSHPDVKPLYDAAYAAGVDLVLTGHDHNYQRFIKMNPNLQADPKGFVQVVVGTGGRDFYSVSTSSSLLATRPNSTSKAASGSTFGVLKLTLSPTGYAGEFVRSQNAGNGDFGSSTRPEYFSGTCNKASSGTTYAVSGAVTTASGAAIGGVRVSSGSATATTNTSGQYTLTGLANGTYTLSPSLAGYTFSPSSQSVTVNGANVTGRNFTGTVASSGSTVVHNVNLPSVSTGNWSSMYTVNIPAGTTKLVVNISGGTGDADLYVRAGAAPSTTSYTCRPYLNGNAETCSIDNPVAGSTYYIAVRAYSSYSGVTMKATRTP